MDVFEKIKAQNIINEISNQLKKDNIDSSTARLLMSIAEKRLISLLDYISVLESKSENLVAENQRLSHIAKY